MRKTPKVVPITRAKRKQPSTATEVPVQVEGGIQILTCHRTGAQIRFSLGPLLQPGEAPTRSNEKARINSSRVNSSVLSSNDQPSSARKLNTASGR